TRFSRDWSSDVCSSDLIDRSQHHHRKAESRRQIKHSPPTDAAPFAVRRFAENLEQHITIELGKQRRFEAAGVIAVVPFRQAFLRSEERRVGKEGRCRGE